jgi:hypothetical protein
MSSKDSGSSKDSKADTQKAIDAKNTNGAWNKAMDDCNKPIR